MAASTPLQQTTLLSEYQTDLLDNLHSLRTLGLTIPSTQIVVCGHWSIGKSSVLETLSGIPFPSQDRFRSQFVTEIVFRRSSEEKITISVIPSNRRWNVQYNITRLEDFPGWYENVRNAMGSIDTGKSDSKDILRIEICGCNQLPFTIIDLPAPTPSDDSQPSRHVQLVSNLASSYLENPRTIILAIISATQSINSWAIPGLIQQVDPDFRSTLGIVTEPGKLVRDSQVEQEFLALAKNEIFKLGLGWHIVQSFESSSENGQKETLETRDIQEMSYFRESNFSILPSHAVGNHALRSHLSKAIFQNIQLELPKLISEVENRISARKTALDRPSPSRKTPFEQQLFLIQLSQSFQSICQAAIMGDYSHDFFRLDENADRRLSANLMHKHFEFAEQLQKFGSSWYIVDTVSDDPRSKTRAEVIKDATSRLSKGDREVS